MIDITCTCTLRPKIFEKTMNSFFKYMLNNVPCRLIMNVDPIGEDGVTQNDMIHIAQKFPFKQFLINTPKEPKFTKAVIWCWKNIQNEYILHLEDDWELLLEIDIKNMLNILKKNKNLASLKLSKENLKFNSESFLSGVLYEEKFSLNPNLVKREFLYNVVTKMIEDKNPEKQIRINNNNGMSDYIKKWKFGIYTYSGINKIVNDLGRPWMTNTKFKKPIGFMKWENK